MLHTTKKHSRSFAKTLLNNHLEEPLESRVHLQGKGGECIEAFFLGNHGGNGKYMQELLQWAVQGNVDFRKNYFPNDADYIDQNIQNSKEFVETLKLLGFEYQKLITQLQKSGTFFSMRSIGHMLWDTNTPGILGYIAALLYNQNNVAAEASPVTTLLEMYVGNDLCKMLGFSVQPIGNKSKNSKNLENKITGWGHITCDGSVANLEGLWMARNLKFYPISVKTAIEKEKDLEIAKNFEVQLLDGTTSKLLNVDDWSLLNLPIDEILSIPDKISKQYQIDLSHVSDLVNKYSVQSLGYHDILTQYLPSIKTSPVSICSGTRHYSWPKGAAILGIGANNMLNISIDEKARMHIDDFRKTLEHCYTSKIPVMNVVAIIGTTEESAVDPLNEILKIREEYRKKGMEFAIHADAAWGGYFKTMIISEKDDNDGSFQNIHESKMETLPMSSYVLEQYKVLQLADSVTVDPHKSGYVPYPAGALCYRNSAMRNLVAFTAPVVYHGGVDPTVGVYGVEGSKPGAAAAAVYLSHKMIRPNENGYGKISGACFFNAKRLYAALVCLNISDVPFYIVPLIPIPAVQEKKSPEEIQKQYKFIRDRIVNVTNEQLVQDKEAFALFKELGGDQTIITYLFNYYDENGNTNQDMQKTNAFNDEIYKTFSYKPGEKHTEDTEIVVTSSSFTKEIDGEKIINSLHSRLGVTTNLEAPINFIISTIMNPFLSSTVKGSFIPELMSIITQNISAIALKIQKT